MLKLIWSPGKSCCPENPDFQQAVDTLSDKDTGTVLQEFPKAQSTIDPGAIAPLLAAAIDQWLQVKPRSRIVVMVHGYQFDPTGHVGNSGDDPYTLVYGVPTPGGPAGVPPAIDYHNSWLPIVGECDQSGQNEQDLAIAFAWLSEGNLSDYNAAGWGSDYQYAALDLAPNAAKALAMVLAYLGSKGASYDILAHSLGTRVTSQAIGMLRRNVDDKTIGRVVLLGGAEYCVDANATMFGREFDVINIANREDKVLVAGAEFGCAPFRPAGLDSAMVIGWDGLIPNYKWLDIQIDSSGVIAWMLTKTYSVSGEADNDIHPASGLNHWAYYMNDGNRGFLTALFANAAMTIAWFTQGGLPGGIDRSSYGHFNPTIPPTPGTCEARAAVLGPNELDGGD